MEKIKQYILEKFGRDLFCFHEDFFRKTIDKRMESTGICDLDGYFQRIKKDRMESELLMDALSIPYTEFFREPFAFLSLSKQILPEIIHRKGFNHEIRIWSVGCSTGQEAYSIAMTVQKLMDKTGNAIKLRIFASDISDAALQRAQEGCYSRAEVKHLSLEDLDRFFEKNGNHYTVCSQIKEQVKFLSYDILDTETICPIESIFGGFDLIFCRNLLIYYRPGWQKMILEKLQKSLAADGYLITGEAEAGTVKKWVPQSSLEMTGAVFTRATIGTGGQNEI